MAVLRTLFDTPARARISAQAYLESPYSERKSDLIEGVFVMASPASFDHEDIQAFLIALMRFHAEFHGLGKVLGPNAAYKLSEQNVFQPDVSFVRRERLNLVQPIYFPGPPDVAVEIVSPSSRQYDEVEKKINYGRFDVKEYWLVDPIEETLRFYSQAEGELVPLPPDEDGNYRSRVLEGFWLRTEWLFVADDEERPSVVTIARHMGLLPE